MPKITSPLRYPGAKSNLVKYISLLVQKEFPDGNLTFVEPYAGSAIVSLSLIYKGLAENAIIVERDPLIYAFWDAVFTIPDELVSNIDALDVSLDTWHNFQKYRNATTQNEYPLIEMATAGFFFNRTNFSGILKANPLGGLKQKSQYKIDCRFNKGRLIEQIKLIAALGNKVQVFFGDALEFMTERQFWFRAIPCFLYIDPPYFAKGKSLYRYWYEMDDHRQLATFLLNLEARVKWLVSYDNRPEIEHLYSNSIRHRVYFDYCARSHKSEQELLMSNMKIPPLDTISSNNKQITL